MRSASSKSAGREAAFGMGRDRHRHRVPRDREVGMVAHLLGRPDDRLREVDRADEVVALELLADRVSGALPAFEVRQAAFDLRVVELVPSDNHIPQPSWHAEYREPRPVRNRGALRARPGRQRRRRHARVRLAGRGARAARISPGARSPTACLPRDRLGGSRADREGRGDLRPGRRRARAPAARPDRDAGSVRGLRRLLRRRLLARGDAARCAGRALARPRDARTRSWTTWSGSGGSAASPSAARRLRDELRGRVARVESGCSGAPKPRVAALEWLDPPFVGGHWVPEMIEAAGGTDALGEAGVKSRTATWEEIQRRRRRRRRWSCRAASMRTRPPSRPPLTSRSSRATGAAGSVGGRCGVVVLSPRAAPRRRRRARRPPAPSGAGRGPRTGSASAAL